MSWNGIYICESCRADQSLYLEKDTCTEIKLYWQYNGPAWSLYWKNDTEI